MKKLILLLFTLLSFSNSNASNLTCTSKFGERITRTELTAMFEKQNSIRNVKIKTGGETILSAKLLKGVPFDDYQKMVGERSYAPGWSEIGILLPNKYLEAPTFNAIVSIGPEGNEIYYGFDCKNSLAN